MQAWLVRQAVRLQKKALLFTDERSKLEGELLNGIDVVKCNSWEVRASRGAVLVTCPWLCASSRGAACSYRHHGDTSCGFHAAMWLDSMPHWPQLWLRTYPLRNHLCHELAAMGDTHKPVGGLYFHSRHRYSSAMPEPSLTSVSIVLIPIHCVRNGSCGIASTLCMGACIESPLHHVDARALRMQWSMWDRIQGVREQELGTLWRSFIIQALFGFTLNTIPVLVSVLTFGVYVLLGNKLTAAEAFTSLSLFTVHPPVALHGIDSTSQSTWLLQALPFEGCRSAY